MKRYETKTRPAIEYRDCVARACDLCGRETKRGLDNWSGERFRVEEVEVRIKEGVSYPEGGSGTEIEFDICPDCFRGRLIPWLESQGAKAEEEDWYW